MDLSTPPNDQPIAGTTRHQLARTLWREVTHLNGQRRCRAGEALLELYGVCVDEATRCGDLLDGLGSDDAQLVRLARAALGTLIGDLSEVGRPRR